MDFSSFGGGIMGFLGGERQNYSNAKQASDQMKFQEDMSNTAHQREVADLRAAGLNPILSANRGASSPGGAMATMQNTVASAMDAARVSQEIRNAKQTEKNLVEMNRNIIEDSYLKTSARTLNNALYNSQLHITDQEASRAAVEREKIPGARIEGAIDRSYLGEAARRVDRVGGAVSSAVGLGRLRNLIEERPLPPRSRYRRRP